MNQEPTCRLIQTIKDHPTDITSSRGKTRRNLSSQEQYIAQRALGAYIASMSQPEATFDLSYAAQSIHPQPTDITALNKHLAWQNRNATGGLHYIQLDTDNLQLVAFADSSFANNKDLSSQIGFVITLADANGNANIIHWSSIW